MICPFCGMPATKMGGSMTIRCMRAGIKWIWFACTDGHEWGHRQKEVG